MQPLDRGAAPEAVAALATTLMLAALEAARASAGRPDVG